MFTLTSQEYNILRRSTSTSPSRQISLFPVSLWEIEKFQKSCWRMREAEAKEKKAKVKVGSVSGKLVSRQDLSESGSRPGANWLGVTATTSLLASLSSLSYCHHHCHHLFHHHCHHQHNQKSSSSSSQDTIQAFIVVVLSSSSLSPSLCRWTLETH